MKLNNYITKEEISNLDEDTCECCYTYEKLQEKTQQLRHDMNIDPYLKYCPICGRELDQLYDNKAIMGANFYDENHDVLIGNIYHCSNCSQYFTDAVQHIEYNGNHDVFYSNQHYLPTEEYTQLQKDVQEMVSNCFKEYSERKDTGVSISNLTTWLCHGIEHVLCDFLHNKGYKIQK